MTKLQYLGKGILSVAAVAAMLVTSCSKDSDYDALTEDDGIDLTITVAQGGLSLPFGSTDYIYLTELMDSAEVDVLNIDAEGNFFICEDGNLDRTHFRIDEASVDINPDVSPRAFEFAVVNLDGANIPGFNLLPDGMTLGDLITSTETVEVHCSAVNFDDDNRFDFEGTDIDRGLIAIESVSLKNTEKLTIQFIVSNLPAPNDEYYLNLDNMSIDYPSYLIVDGRAGATSVAIENAHIRKPAGQSSITWSTTHSISGFDFSTLDNGGIGLVNDNGTIKLSGEVSIHGNASIVDLNIGGADLRKKGSKIVLNDSIHFTPTLNINTLTLDSITGRFSPDIDDLNSHVDLDLGDDMDFLKTDAHLNLKDPVINLNMNYVCDVPVYADMVLTADNGVSVSYDNVDLSHGTIHFTKNVKGTAAEGYYANESLGDLLASIPDKIDVYVHPYIKGDETYGVGLGKDFSVEGVYDVNVPLTFDHIDIKYDEVIDDVWGDNPEDITDYVTSINTATLTLVATNTVPMDLDLQVSANGKDGRENPALVNYETDGIIPAGSLVAPSHTTMVVSIDIPDVAAVKDLIVRVKGDGNDSDFNANQYIKLENMTVKIANQEIDLNDK